MSDNQESENVLGGIGPEDIENDIWDFVGQPDGVRIRGVDTSTILRVLVEVCGHAIRNDKDHHDHQGLFDEFAAMAVAMADANRHGDH